MRRGDAQHPWAVRADHQRRPGRSRPARQQLGVARLVEAPVEVDRAILQQCPDDRERLLEPVDAMVERDAEGAELGLVPAGAQAEDQPAAADLVDRRGLLGEDSRVVERRAGDQRAELDAVGDRSDRGENRPGLPRPTRGSVGPAIEEVLAEPDGVIPESSMARVMSSSSGQRTSRSTSGSWTPILSGRSPIRS